MVPVMYKAVCDGGQWVSREVIPYGPLCFDPAAKVLHYGEEIFEGLKAYRTEGKRPSLFRPQMNAARLSESAKRLSMPEIPQELFMEGVTAVSAYAEPFIPTAPGTSLYIRPFMIGVDASLLLDPSRRFEFYVIASPSVAYHAGNMKVVVERQDCRAALGGTGHVKVGGNYAAAQASAKRVRERGFDQSLWLDPGQRKNVEELSGMNVFAVIDGELHTPSLSGSILPGVTRDSIITLAKRLGYVLHERAIAIDDLLEDMKSGRCSEFFACGTAAVITPISEICDPLGDTIVMPEQRPVAAALRQQLTDIQEGRAEDVFGWNYPVPPSAELERQHISHDSSTDS